MSTIPALFTFTPGLVVIDSELDSNFQNIRDTVNTYCLFTDIARTVTATLTLAASLLFSGATTDLGDATHAARNGWFTGSVHVGTTGAVGVAAGDVIIASTRGLRGQTILDATRTAALVEMVSDSALRLGKGDLSQMSVLIGNRNEGTVGLTGGEIVMGSAKNLVFANFAGTGYQVALTTDAANRLYVGLGFGGTPQVVALGNPGSTTNAAAGELLLGNAKALRFSNGAGTDTLKAIFADAANHLHIGHITGGAVTFGMPGAIMDLVAAGVQDGDVVIRTARNIKSSNAANTGLLTLIGADAGDNVLVANGTTKPIGLGTNFTTDGSAGDAILRNARGLRFVNSAGTHTLSMIESGISNDVHIGHFSTGGAISLGLDPAIADLVATLGATANDVVIRNQRALRGANVASSGSVRLVEVDASDRVLLSGGGADIRIGRALIALGGGAAPTFGTIGGSGPAVAAQNTWAKFIDSAGVAFYVPVWK